MGKQPAFQFYPNDWTRDLQEHPIEIEGAWIRICCKLWYSETRGKLTRTPYQWSAILGVSEDHTKRIFDYINLWKIGDILTDPNGDLTVISRRMLRDEIARENNCLRQKRFYDKRKHNAPITPTSQHSSSSSSKKESKKEKKSSPSKTKYLDSVLLTDSEYEKLQEALGQKNLENGIEQLDYSITVKGGKYKDHYKTLLNWFKRGFISDGNGNNRNNSADTQLTKPKTYEVIDPSTIMDRQRIRDEEEARTRQ